MYTIQGSVRPGGGSARRTPTAIWTRDSTIWTGLIKLVCQRSYVHNTGFGTARWGQCKAYANCYLDGGFGDGPCADGFGICCLYQIGEVQSWYLNKMVTQNILCTHEGKVFLNKKLRFATALDLIECLNHVK